jgi:hypothetical protein
MTHSTDVRSCVWGELGSTRSTLQRNTTKWTLHDVISPAFGKSILHVRDQLIHPLHCTEYRPLLQCADPSHTRLQACVAPNNNLRRIAAPCAAIGQHSLRNFRATRTQSAETYRGSALPVPEPANTNSQLTWRAVRGLRYTKGASSGATRIAYAGNEADSLTTTNAILTCSRTHSLSSRATTATR